LPEAGKESLRESFPASANGWRPIPKSRTSASAGVAAFPEDGDTPEKLLGCGDRALYRMKASRSSIKNLSRHSCVPVSDDMSPLRSRIYPFHRTENRIPWELAVTSKGINRCLERNRRFTENVSFQRSARGSVAGGPGCPLVFTARNGEFRSSARVVLPTSGRRRLCNWRGVPRHDGTMDCSKR